MNSRREFICALAGTACVKSFGLPTLGAERLRIGVLSDVHITTDKQLSYFERALRKFDEWKVDGVLGASDIADYGLVQELRLAAETWFKVFPEGRSATDGRPVANLMHYGDHDMATWYVDESIAKKICPDDAERKASLLFPLETRKRAWEECFHEPFEQISVKEVKGYTFVLSHFTRGEAGNRSGNAVPGLEEAFARLKIDSSKPFFYSQHRIPRNTVGGPDMWGQDDGQTTKLFSNYPNLLAFCGHCHMTSSFERCIWQGGFTCVQIPSLRYCVTSAGRENTWVIDDRPKRSPAQPSKCMKSIGSGDRHQGLLMTVYDQAIVLRRWEFTQDAPTGPDWVIPLSSFALPPAERPFAFAQRAQTSRPPEFDAKAKVAVSKFAPGKKRDGTAAPMLTVSFPPAVDFAENRRANDYSVSLELKQFDCTRVFLEKRVYSPAILGTVASETDPVTCAFAEDEIPEGWKLRFTVRPVDAFENRGRPISSLWTVLRKPPQSAQA